MLWAYPGGAREPTRHEPFYGQVPSPALQKAALLTARTDTGWSPSLEKPVFGCSQALEVLAQPLGTQHVLSKYWLE